MKDGPHIARIAAGGLRVTQIGAHRSYEHTLGPRGLYDLPCTCPEFLQHGALCRHGAASLLYVKRAGALGPCDETAAAERSRLASENKQLRADLE